jgi:uncharacterized protein YxjI
VQVARLLVLRTPENTEVAYKGPMNLESLEEVIVVQRKELGEIIFSTETRNKYEIKNAQGQLVGFAAEQGKGLLGLLFRHFLGHWRKFDIKIFDEKRSHFLTAHHPFRFFFQAVEVSDAGGKLLGTLQQRFSILSKRFDVLDAAGNVLLQMKSGLFRIWTFPFLKNGTEVARIEKKWAGLLSEVFTDADKFRIAFGRASLLEKQLLLAAGIFVDLQYFEETAHKSSSSSSTPRAE